MSNYFELLGIEKKYNIDINILTAQYFAMQTQYHPDMAKTAQEKQNNLAISIDLNKAYRILKDNWLRAEYLLSLNNITLSEAKIRQGMTKTQLNEIWLDLEQLENSNKLLELEYMLKNTLIKKEDLIKLLTIAFDKKDIELAVELTIKLKYFQNFINNIQDKITLCK